MGSRPSRPHGQWRGGHQAHRRTRRIAVRVELWALDENLCRAELTPAQVADHLARRKAIYLERHPETANGGAPGKAGGGKVAKTGKSPSFAEDAAEKIGIHRRTVEKAVARGEKIAPDVLQAVQGTPLDKGASLDALARMEPEEQRAVVAAGELPRIVEREPEPEIEYKPEPAIDYPPALVKADADTALADDRSFEKIAALLDCASEALVRRVNEYTAELLDR